MVRHIRLSIKTVFTPVPEEQPGWLSVLRRFSLSPDVQVLTKSLPVWALPETKLELYTILLSTTTWGLQGQSFELALGDPSGKQLSPETQVSHPRCRQRTSPRCCPKAIARLSSSETTIFLQLHPMDPYLWSIGKTSVVMHPLD
ncbi:hypothetical protein ACOMHN_010675 [Nucella lapillus]